MSPPPPGDGHGADAEHGDEQEMGRRERLELVRRQDLTAAHSSGSSGAEISCSGVAASSGIPDEANPAAADRGSSRVAVCPAVSRARRLAIYPMARPPG